ncbi:MAG TPA: glycoside hydrolase family 38 C-terminal domain-containing protein [Fimbriimonadaceae bacterium]|nr:glycoside hydrolase family 38 C-terminal domain-containing protein [Fimbriimonadaceae bacterium]HRJ33534.1 glycoside hydrolase family 38 C-terminal domain-containing protein [Fimbriimonadaceae bacterium]
MEKHPTITLARIQQFWERELKPRHDESAPLKIETCDGEFRDEAAARANGKWRPAPAGMRYGPAYTIRWFRVTGQIPSAWAGLPVALVAEVGGERTIWRDLSPVHGLDGPHAEAILWQPAQGGEAVDLVIQAYTMNPQATLHGREPARQADVAEVQTAYLTPISKAKRRLAYDVLFVMSLIEGLPETDPGRAHLLRAANQMVNTYRDQPSGWAQASKMLREALESLGGELPHAITPVGHAHLDTAWLWPIRMTRLKMAHTAANQLALMERYPQHVFVHSQASQYEWLETDAPALLLRIKEAIKRGQWEVVGSMWVEADCNLAGGEALVRQILYGKRYFEQKLGVKTEDLWLPDVFGYSAAMPQILKKFGIEAFLTQKISWNQSNKFPHNTFWWKGIDGTAIWSHFPPADTYVGDASPRQLLQSVRQHKDHGRSDQSLYVFGFGDGGGGPTEQHLELLKRAVRTPCLPEIRWGQKAVEFFREARNQSQDLCTWTGELYLEYHRGTYTSQAANKRGNREIEMALRDAEFLACFAPDFPQSYESHQFEKHWKLLLLNQFHDILPGSSVREVYEDSDQDYAQLRQATHESLQTSLTALGRSMETSHMHSPVAVFHNSTIPSQVTMPWPEAPVPESVATGEAYLPVQIVDFAGGRSLIFETPGAALGSVAVVDLSPQAPTEHPRLKTGPRRLENRDWIVRFDPHGNITSIQSVHDPSLDFVEPGKLANVIQLLDDQPLFWSAWDIDPYAFETAKSLIKSDSFEIVEKGPVRVAAEWVKTFGRSRMRQRISLGPTPGIRFETWIDWQEENKLLKAAFPMNVNTTRATCDIQFGHVERPTHRNTSWDAAKFEVCAQKWVDLSEGGHGAALINQGKYGHDFLGSTMRLSLLRAPKAPDPICDMGEHRFTYVLLPHFDDVRAADVVATAYAINAEPRVAPLQPAAGVDGELPRLVACDDRNLIIESVKKAEDSNAIVVRLYECHNSRGSAFLSLARPIKRAFLADLNEQPTLELDRVEDGVAIDYKPFEIITLLIEI